MSALEGKTVAFLVADGFEQVEMTEPWKAVEEAGGTPRLVGKEGDQVRGFHHFDQGDAFDVDIEVSAAEESGYDALVLPGGVHNPDQLRTDRDALAFVRSFFEAGKPVAVICHGPWTLIDAGVVEGRTLTSFPSLRTDLENAGATWVDEEVHVDAGLVTSRTPDDLPAFNAKVVEEIREGIHAEQTAAGMSS